MSLSCIIFQCCDLKENHIQPTGYHKQLMKKKLFCFFSEDSVLLDDLEDESPGGNGKSLESGIKKEETQR